LVDYAVPPLLGALIGYFTNYVAVKMLFRPYRAYYVFGKKLPFTPGLIPSKREKLAGAIARVVKENLVTEEAIRSRLNEEKVKESLRSFVDSALSGFEKRSEEIIYGFLKNLEGKKLSFLFGTEGIDEKAEKLVRLVSGWVNGKKVSELVPPKLYREFEEFLDVKVEELAEVLIEESGKPEFRELVYSFVKANVDRLRNVLPVIPEEISISLSQKVSSYILDLVGKVSKSPEFRVKLSKVLWAKVQEFMGSRIDTESKVWKGLEKVLRRVVEEVLGSLLSKNLSRRDVEFVSGEISRLLSLFLKEHREEVVERVSEELLKVVERELPVILNSLDLESLVRNKVNELPIEEVEGLILKLISEELKYITLMGGVLGFLIGSLQILFL